MSTLDFAARHTCDSPEWYTPSPFAEAARDVMGGIDLDPASHEEANCIVKATRFYTAEEDGLQMPWFGRVFVNPPGGLVPEFWCRVVASFNSNEFDEAIWIGYSLQQLQTLQNECAETPLDFTMCVPSKRIAFVENEAKRAERIAKLLALGKKPNEKSTPSHANYISYIGIGHERFARRFSEFGKVVLL